MSVTGGLRNAALSAVADCMGDADGIAVESGDRLGPAMLQMIAAGLRPDAGDAVWAFIVADGDGPGVLRSAWESRQMHAHVLLAPRLLGAAQVAADRELDLATTRTPPDAIANHVALVSDAARLGFEVFLCGELPGLRDPLVDSGDLARFRGAVERAGTTAGIEVRFPLLDRSVREELAALPADARLSALQDVASAWLPAEARRPITCHGGSSGAVPERDAGRTGKVADAT